MPADGAADRRPSEPEGPNGDVYDWYRRGVALMGSGSPAAAVPLLERAAAADASPSIQEALGRALFDSRRYAEAAECFKRIVEANPAEDYARFGLGLALSRSGDFEGAVEHLALAAAMRPGVAHYEDALRQAGATLAARGR